MMLDVGLQEVPLRLRIDNSQQPAFVLAMLIGIDPSSVVVVEGVTQVAVGVIAVVVRVADI